jgi:hypothetical protein
MNTLTSIKKDLYIRPTKYFPEVSFKQTGELKITGRLINDHLERFFEPVFSWVETLDVEEVKLELNLEYLNTSGVAFISRLIRTIECNFMVKDIIVKWYFEEDDESHQELGELIQLKRSRSKFKFIVTE